MLLARILKQFLGVLVAILGGWLAGILFTFAWATIDVATHSGEVTAIALFVQPWIVALGSAVFIYPVLLALVPLYFFVPRSSLLWRWPICTSLGALAGTCIVFGFFSRPDVNPPESKLSWCVLAVLIGAATSFVGSTTREHFGYWNPSNS
jgi:hypothetical protein